MGVSFVSSDRQTALSFSLVAYFGETKFEASKYLSFSLSPSLSLCFFWGDKVWRKRISLSSSLSLSLSLSLFASFGEIKFDESKVGRLSRFLLLSTKGFQLRNAMLVLQSRKFLSLWHPEPIEFIPYPMPWGFQSNVHTGRVSNLRANPLMLLATCVNTSICNYVFQNLHIPVPRCSASCVNWTSEQRPHWTRTWWKRSSQREGVHGPKGYISYQSRPTKYGNVPKNSAVQIDCHGPFEEIIQTMGVEETADFSWCLFPVRRP